MYVWGMTDQATALRMLDYVPAISPGMLARVGGELSDLGPLAVLRGPLLGTPYKTYAVQAASAGLGFVPFLLISIPARLVRFMLVTAMVHWLANLLTDLLSNGLAKDSLKLRYGLAIGGWIVFYTAYFSFMPN
jgi:hypothetical protein